MLTFESKGNMTISSSSILDAPVISPNWLTTNADVEQVHAAFLRLREISSHWSTVQSEVLPGPTVTNKTAILAYVQEHGSSIYHGSSTCK
jgi:choline dehydrogenase